MSQNHRIDTLYSPLWKEPLRLLLERLAHVHHHVPDPSSPLLPHDHTRIPAPILPSFGNRLGHCAPAAGTGDIIRPLPIRVIAARRQHLPRSGLDEGYVSLKACWVVVRHGEAGYEGQAGGGAGTEEEQV